MGGNINGFGQLAATKNFDTILARNKAVLHQHINIEISDILSFGKRVERINVDTNILDTVDILETKFRNAAIERHLTTLEANLLMVARTCFSTLVTTRGSATLARTSTTANTFRMLDRTFSGFKIT